MTVTTDIANPEGYRKLAGDNIPGTRPITSPRPGGALEHSLRTMVIFRENSCLESDPVKPGQPKKSASVSVYQRLKIRKAKQGQSTQKNFAIFFRALLREIIGKSSKNRQKNRANLRKKHAIFDVFFSSHGLWASFPLPHGYCFYENALNE